MAPDLRTVWNPWPTGEMFLNFRIFLRASLIWVSITWLWGNLDVVKRGAEGGSDLDLRRACRARNSTNICCLVGGAGLCDVVYYSEGFLSILL